MAIRPVGFQGLSEQRAAIDARGGTSANRGQISATLLVFLGLELAAATAPRPARDCVMTRRWSGYAGEAATAGAAQQAGNFPGRLRRKGSNLQPSLYMCSDAQA
jgi:hypothetical protein